MARKGGLNPDWRANVSVTNYHPIISASVFSHLTGTSGGATMDVNTGDFVDVENPERDTYVVGKEPDTEGNPIQTKRVSSTESFTKFPRMVSEIRKATGGRAGASIGSWRKDDGSIDIDASAQEPNLGKALNKAKERNEEAIFSTKKFRESGYKNGDIENPFYKPPTE